jgi:hypothetical protein
VVLFEGENKFCFTRPILHHWLVLQTWWVTPVLYEDVHVQHSTFKFINLHLRDDNDKTLKIQNAGHCLMAYKHQTTISP